MTSVADDKPEAVITPIDAEVVAAAADTVSAIEAPPTRPTHKLSNGTVLRFKSIPPLVMQQAASQIVPPKIPTWKNPDHNDKEEENPLDPDYKEALRLFGERQFMAVSDVVLLIGTEVVSLGENVEACESDNWVDQLDTLGIAVDTSKPNRRKLSWMKLHVLSSPADLADVFRLAITAAGISEERVAQMVTAFRGVAER